MPISPRVLDQKEAKESLNHRGQEGERFRYIWGKVEAAPCSMIHLRHQTQKHFFRQQNEKKPLKKLSVLFLVPKAHQSWPSSIMYIKCNHNFFILLILVTFASQGIEDQHTPSGLKWVPALLQLKLTSPTAWMWSPCSPRFSPRTFPWILTWPIHCKANYALLFSPLFVNLFVIRALEQSPKST